MAFTPHGHPGRERVSLPFGVWEEPGSAAVVPYLWSLSKRMAGGGTRPTQPRAQAAGFLQCLGGQLRTME